MSSIYFLRVVIPMCREDIDALFVKGLNSCKRSAVCASRYSRKGLVVVLQRFSKLEKDYFGFESKYSHILGVNVYMKVQIRITFSIGALLDEMSERQDTSVPVYR